MVCNQNRGSTGLDYWFPILFNVFINDIFFIIKNTEICNFADDTTIYTCGNNLEEVVCALKTDTIQVNHWFQINSMVANPAKFQLMYLGNDSKQASDLDIDGIILTPLNAVKLLGVTLDNTLSFDDHISSMCKLATNKTHGLLRIRPFIDRHKACSIYKAYILSVFNYCPLVWMFCSKASNKMIENTQKRALRAVLNQYDQPLDKLLTLINSSPIHTRNLQQLMVEIYKTLNLLNPEFMQEIFQTKTCRYFMRGENMLTLPPSRTSRFGTNSIGFRGCLTWNTLPNKIKSSPNLLHFKKEIKNWTGEKCGCILCK